MWRHPLLVLCIRVAGQVLGFFALMFVYYILMWASKYPNHSLESGLKLLSPGLRLVWLSVSPGSLAKMPYILYFQIQFAQWLNFHSNICCYKWTIYKWNLWETVWASVCLDCISFALCICVCVCQNSFLAQRRVLGRSQVKMIQQIRLQDD